MKGIDVKLLRAFVVLAEKGSYHQAADALYLTQPALSKQIKALESLVGNPLFHRGRHGAQLTETGNKLLDRAHQLLHSHADFIHYAKSINIFTWWNRKILLPTMIFPNILRKALSTSIST